MRFLFVFYFPTEKILIFGLLPCKRGKGKMKGGAAGEKNQIVFDARNFFPSFF